MRFIREIPLENLTSEIILNLLSQGFILLYGFDSVEIWVDCTPEAITG